jgi:translation initiation factor 1A
MQSKHAPALHLQEENKGQNVREQQEEDRSLRRVGKRKVVNEDDMGRVPVPSGNDVLGVAIKLLGFDRIMVKCQDGHERLCRIRGKLKRRVWIRVGDIVLVSPWDFQSDTRGDIFGRYKKNQTTWLRSQGYLTMQI